MNDYEDLESPNKEENQATQKNSKSREKIKEELSKMSFEDLQKLKAEIGIKLYSKTVFGDKEKKIVQTSFKRENKNRPREMSSKKQMQSPVVAVKKHIVRDPRFESMCGTFDKKTFKDNYKFVNDIRKKEKKQLEDALMNTEDEEEKKRIKFLIHRLDNQIREDEKRQEQPEREYKEKRQLDTYENKSERPQIKKKSVKKLESLINKFEELKKTNKIQKHIERKSKKVTAKERKKLERQNLL